MIDECGLDVVFAAGTIGIKRDLVIESAPLAEIDRLAVSDVKDMNARTTIGCMRRRLPAELRNPCSPG